MCTAIKVGSFAGRNLDIEKSYGESLIVTPRKYVLHLRKSEDISEHYAFFGIGTVSDGYPLYYDAVNEHGLYIAGLNYVGYAKYHSPNTSKVDLAPYELIPYLLSACKSVSEAKSKLKDINLVNIPFSLEFPTAELHFFIADKRDSITVEPDAEGLNIYDNPIGVLTNNPPFPFQLFNLNNYLGLSSRPAENRFSADLPLVAYSRGMGALGLPGDLSSSSRFVRVAFHKANAVGRENLADIMHLLMSVSMPEGSVKLGCGYERTEYTSAVDLSRLIYSYRTYESPITYAIKMANEELDGNALIHYELKREKEPFIVNGPNQDICVK